MYRRALNHQIAVAGYKKKNMVWSKSDQVAEKNHEWRKQLNVFSLFMHFVQQQDRMAATKFW